MSAWWLIAIGSILAALGLIGGAMITAGVSRLNQAKANGIIRGMARLEGETDHGGVEVLASPGHYKATTDRQGNYELQHLSGSMYALRFAKELYHETELSNIPATEDGSYRTPSVELKRNTTYGWRVLPNVPFSSTNDASLVSTPDGDLFLGTGVAGSLYRSEDDGSSWNRIHQLSKEHYIGQVICAASHSIITSVRPRQNPPQFIAFHQSSDEGQTWNQVELPTNGMGIENMISCGKNAYAGTSPPRKDSEVTEKPILIRSIDNGLSWQVASSFEDAILVKPLFCAKDGTLFAEAIKDTPPQACRLYLSKDGAETWERCADFPFRSPLWVAGLIQDAQGNFVCVGTYSENSPGYHTAILRSQNPLSGWELLSKLNGSVDSRTPPLIRSARSNNFYLRSEQEVLVSTNNGLTWQREFRDEGGGVPLVLIQSTSGHLLLVVFYPAYDGVASQSTSKSKLWISDKVK